MGELQAQLSPEDLTFRKDKLSIIWEAHQDTHLGTNPNIGTPSQARILDHSIPC
jgi:hypothetical protein